MKLSETQIQLLKDLEQGSILHFMRYMGTFNPNAYWFVSHSMRRVRCSTVEKLKRLRLVTVTQKGPFGEGVTVRITEQGKAAIPK